ncbi:MAG TPA: phytanoyl-CoA dioxygenase family protein [Acidimicrobiales bacterium]|nr:phytanoyl-CoA dioxygenase family protein [Acidimicrobiales bacterium]
MSEPRTDPTAQPSEHTTGPRRHAWNTGFTWQDRTGPFRRLTEEQVARFDTDGYLVLPEVLDADELVAVVAALDRFEAETDAALAQADGGRVLIAETGAITFTTHLVERSSVAAQVSRHPVLLDVCADLISGDVSLYWDQAVYKKPTKPRRFPWHQDNGYTYVEPQQYLTCWMALTDASRANGCPMVAPGLHRLGTLAHTYVDPLGYECFTDPPVAAVAAEVPAGGAVVFSSLTPHLTGPNTTDGVRKAYILQYAPTGAVALRGDPEVGPPTAREPCAHPARQYQVLRDRRPVTQTTR